MTPAVSLTPYQRPGLVFLPKERDLRALHKVIQRLFVDSRVRELVVKKIIPKQGVKTISNPFPKCVVHSLLFLQAGPSRIRCHLMDGRRG